MQLNIFFSELHPLAKKPSTYPILNSPSFFASQKSVSFPLVLPHPIHNKLDPRPPSFFVSPPDDMK